MKKEFWYYAFALLLTLGGMTTLASCSDDDDDDTAVVDGVEGTYDGSLSVKIGTDEVANESKSLKLDEDTDKKTVDVEIDDFTLNVKLNAEAQPIPVNLGDLEVDDCKLTKIAAENYTFSGSTRLNNIQVPLAPGTNVNVDCNVVVQNATVKGKALSMPIVVSVYMGGLTSPLMTVNVDYTGTRR